MYQIHKLTLHILLRAALYRAYLIVDIAGTRDLLQNSTRTLSITFAQQPTRAFGHQEYTNKEQHGGHSARSKHPAPVIVQVGQQVVGQIRQQYTDYHRKLVNRNHTAANSRRAHLRYIERRQHRSSTHTDTGNNAPQHKLPVRRCPAHQYRRHRKDARRQDQRKLTAEAIGKVTGQSTYRQCNPHKASCPSSPTELL